MSRVPGFVRHAGHHFAPVVAGTVIILSAVGLSATNDRAAEAARPDTVQPLPGVTFNKHIAPILFESCAGCHRPNQAAPFSLLTYEDALRHATQIVEVTERRYMPPWKPELGHGDFEGVRRLSEDDIQLIRRWDSEGRARGDAADLPPAPQWTAGWRLGTPDVVVTMADRYELPSDGSDVFRTFVVPIPVKEGRYVRAIEFDPGNAKAVHHANLKIDATRSSRWFDEQEPGPGYEGAGARGAKFPDGYFLGWTPGQSPRLSSDGSAWRLEPNSDLVVELHLMPTGKPERIQPSMALYFTEERPSKLPYMIRLGRQDIDIPAGEREYTSTDSYVLPVDVDAVAVQPHAHRLAKDIRGMATLPDGTSQWLIDIRDWDMRWQDVYRYRRPLSLPKGTTLTMRYTYDNSSANIRNSGNPPSRVTFGQTSSSEMGDLWLQVMPRSDADRRRLDADFAPKMLREDIAGIEKMLEMDSSDPRLHTDLGFCYLEARKPAVALAHLEEAARLQPASAGAQYDIGLVLLQERKFGEARRYFNEAVRLKPEFAEAYNNLGVVSHAEQKVTEAVGWYSRALRVSAENAEAEYNLGRALASLGNTDAALEHYRRALDLKPDDAATHSSLATLLVSQEDVDSAVAHYRRALDLDPDLPAALVDLAWILATSERADIRAPAEAVRLAERVSELTDHKNATVLDTLAAAYAASGQIDRAVSTATTALALASESGAIELRERIRTRLAFYEQQRREQKHD